MADEALPRAGAVTELPAPGQAGLTTGVTARRQRHAGRHGAVCVRSTT